MLSESTGRVSAAHLMQERPAGGGGRLWSCRQPERELARLGHTECHEVRSVDLSPHSVATGGRFTARDVSTGSQDVSAAAAAQGQVRTRAQACWNAADREASEKQSHRAACARKAGPPAGELRVDRATYKIWGPW